MFTGLIKGIGTVLEKKVTSQTAVLKIRTGLVEQLQLGDSIAVNGVCLTATALGGNWFTADIMPETWKNTNLSFLNSGDLVNLEPALAMGDRFGGHIVSGHVDGVGKVSSIAKEKNAIIIKIAVLDQLAQYLILKGSVAVNGVSLTIQGLTGNEFMISLIPHTVEQTTFTKAKVGDFINIEVDLLIKQAMIKKDPVKTRITEEFLSRYGFL